MHRPSNDQLDDEYIATAMRYINIHSPTDADRGYDVQLLELMREMAKAMAKENPEFAELFLKALEENQG